MRPKPERSPTRSGLSARRILPRGIQASGRTISFFAGFGLLCAAQVLMVRRAPLLSHDGWGEWLNTRYRLDLSNADNVLLAVCLLICGGGLCVFGLRDEATTRRPEHDPDRAPPIFAWRDHAADLRIWHLLVSDPWLILSGLDIAAVRPFAVELAL